MDLGPSLRAGDISGIHVATVRWTAAGRIAQSG